MLVVKIADVQGIHNRMVRFQEFIKNLFLTLHGHNIHCQQRELSKFLMRYQQFASHAYCGATEIVSKMASQREKAFCVLSFEVSRSVTTVQREFRVRLENDAPHKNNVFFLNCSLNSRCTIITVAARLSASRTGRALLPRNIIFLLLVLISVRS
jgi:hypothetical protein